MGHSQHRRRQDLVSQDEGETWTKPIVIAREPGGQLAYPYMMERDPGVLWIFTRYTWLPKGKAAPFLAVSVKEAELLGEAAK